MEKKPRIERIQSAEINEAELARQREIITENLPEFKSVLVIGIRDEATDKPRNFASCSMGELELAEALLNMMIAHPQTARPICSAAFKYVNMSRDMLKDKSEGGGKDE